VALGKSGDCSILQVTGLETIKTALTSLFISISADILWRRLSPVSNRRARVFQTAVLNAAAEMGAVQRHAGTLAWWLTFEWGWLCHQGLVRLY